MKPVLKILRYFSIVLVATLLLLFCLSYIFQNKVTGIAIKELNRHTESTITIGKVRFSLISNFPRVTVEFRDISVKSSIPAQTVFDSLADKPNLIEAASVSASFNPIRLIRKNYIMQGLEISDAYICIVSNGPGKNNLNFFTKKDNSDSSAVKINLRNIKINNTDFILVGGTGNFYLRSHIAGITGRLSTYKGNTEISYRAKADISKITSRGKTLVSTMPLFNLHGDLSIFPGTLLFSNNELQLGKESLLVEGSINTDEKYLKLDISGENLEIERLLECLSDSLEKNIGKHITGGQLAPLLSLSGPYKPAGNMILKGSVYGKNLIIEPGGKLSPLSLSSFKSLISVNLSSAGRNSEFNITELDVSYAGSAYSGSIRIINPESPNLDLSLSGPVDLKQLLKHHDFKGKPEGTGTVHTSLRLYGNTGSLREVSLKSILSLNRYINLNLDDVDLEFPEEKPGLKKINGNIMIANSIWIDGLSFYFEEQSFVLNCKAGEFVDIFTNNGSPVEINAGIWTNRFDLSTIRKLNTTVTGKNKTALTASHPIIAGLSLNADSLILGNFSCSQFAASASFRDNLLSISSFNALALDGSVSGNAAITKSGSGSYLTRGWYDLENININKAFSSFNNFGQEGLKAENIEGMLSGSLSLSMNTDPQFKPDIKSLEARGFYSLKNGELKNYEPARKLSRFVELSELENIRFEEVKNNLIIEDSRITIPSMDINSTAFNISLSGEQAFNGPFDYHLKILLSDILGKKAMRSKSYISEFGPVEDDGLGRTTLFLRLKGDSKGTVVSYDMAKLSENIKSDINQEKQDLKAILNEEFGWYKKDSISRSTEEKTRKFRITWEEAGSVETLNPEKKQGSGIFSRLFKNTENQEKADTTKKKF
ncbi:MAG: AsmA-like C-terminal region-containing protein [Marinilabiliaceae bacterium]|jgi:hypothetical protein|nr:AsmA-like C-terminal region-containing protein [Marinilabiliaceae bacterium]